MAFYSIINAIQIIPRVFLFVIVFVTPFRLKEILNYVFLGNKIQQIKDMFIKGDILEASNRSLKAGKHYIVYFDEGDDINFIGAMLTHMESEKNSAMSNEHFKTNDSKGNPFKFQYDYTYVVIAKLKKFHAWQPFTKIGELTESGIHYLEYIIGPLEAETWDDYLKRSK